MTNLLQLVCRQRGCALKPARIMPRLCPVCKNPLLMEDQAEVTQGSPEPEIDTLPSESDPPLDDR